MMHRRMFLTLLGSAMTSPALEWMIAQPPQDVASATGRPLSGEVVEHLDSVTASLRRMDDHLGSGQTLGLVRQHLTTVVGLPSDRRYTDTVGRRLHSTGDRGLGANILGFMSCQAKDLGQIRQAVTLAETARAGYPAASPKVAAILDLRAAEAYANERSVTNTRRALDNAFDRFTDGGTEQGDPDWSYWINEAQAHAQAGYCHVRLEDWPRAREHLRTALRLQGNEYTREGALRNALLATTYVQQEHPELDKALALGTRPYRPSPGRSTPPGASSTYAISSVLWTPIGVRPPSVGSARTRKTSSPPEVPRQQRPVRGGTRTGAPSSPARGDSQRGAATTGFGPGSGQ